jgi:hypothetical protein
MDASSLLIVERLIAETDRVDDLKGWLQLAAQHTRQIPEVRQLELFQNQQNPAEFVFFLIVDDLTTVSAILDQAEWHQQLVQELPRLVAGDPERVVGAKIA